MKRRFALFALTMSLISACNDPVQPREGFRGLNGSYTGMLTITTPDTTRADKVTFVLQSVDINNLVEGVYSQIFDTLSMDLTDTPDFCSIPRGGWIIRNAKLVLSPGPPRVGDFCDTRLIPTSNIIGANGDTLEVPFGFRTTNNVPLSEEIGDSLIVRQIRPAEGITTVLELTLTAIP